MKRSKFSEEQIVYAIRQAESGTPVVELCRRKLPRQGDRFKRELLETSNDGIDHTQIGNQPLSLCRRVLSCSDSALTDPTTKECVMFAPISVHVSTWCKRGEVIRVPVRSQGRSD